MQYTIWLAYVSYPATTAAYIERALRGQGHKVLTMGPKITPEIIKAWNLENMNCEVPDLDYLWPANVDMKDMTSSLKPSQFPDIYLWIESVPGYFPENLDAISCPKACYLIDTHIQLETHLQWAKNFDYVFLAQKEYIPEFHKAGINNVFWLPLGCDPEIHGRKSLIKKYDIGFVGSVDGNGRRQQLLQRLTSHYSVHYERCFLEDMARVFSQSKIVFNNAVKDDLNMRVFESLCSGSFLLTDYAYGSGLMELFHDGESLAYYADEEIVERAGFYLEHGVLRESIAATGNAMVLRGHTYAHRCDDLFAVVLGEKKATPDIDELRYRSIDKKLVAVPKKKEYSTEDLLNVEYKYSAQRSFIIPVLDLTSQTEYNFHTLLTDLEKIPGDVIAVFNSNEMADMFKYHPRITYSAVMSHNFGVARAWNIGLDMSDAPVSFILNSDLHIEEKSVDAIEAAVLTLPNAAIAGPEGGYFNFYAAEDLFRYTMGTFTEPMVVDNVSGFFFAVKTDIFHEGTLVFENKFSPCYFEEWDLGIQVKKNQLKAYIVPTDGYDHKFNTHGREGNLTYMQSEESIASILERNQLYFWKKWISDSSERGENHHLRSFWFAIKTGEGEKLLAENKLEEAGRIFMEVQSKDDGNIWVNYYLGLICYKAGMLSDAQKFLKKAIELDPTFPLAQELYAQI